MKEDKNKKKSHAAGYAIILLVALIVILALLAGVFVTSSVVESSHEHTWDDGVETVAATCEDMGTMTYTCTECGEKREETILPLGHDWENEYSEATCVGVGYVTQVCSRCKASQTIPGAQATGVHTMGDEFERDEPTCVETGELRYTCIICGQEIAEELPATGEHVWDGGEVTTEPTCEEAGVMTYTCTLCNEETKTESITALGHDWQNEYCDATCVSAGYVLQSCSRCDATQTITGAQATGVHIMGEEYERTEPTCVDKGELKYTCIICEQEITEDIPATGIHDWGEGKETTAATCEDKGEVVFTCETCGETETRTVSELGHDYEEPSWSWAKEKNEDSGNYEPVAMLSTTCTRCGASETVKASGDSIVSDDEGTYTATAVMNGVTYTDTYCSGDEGLSDLDTNVYTFDQLDEVLESDGKINVMADIESESEMSVGSETEINLNGHTLAVPQVTISGKVTIEDGTIEVEENQYGVKVNAGGDAILTDCTVSLESSQKSTVYGVYVSSLTASSEMSRCSIIVNSSERAAYAVNVVSGTVEISDCYMEGGSSANTGYALYTQYATAKISNCTLVGGSTSSSNGAYGIYSLGSNNEITDCDISATKTSGGGTVYCIYSSSSGTFKISGGSITATHLGTASARAIYVGASDKFEITNCSITAEAADSNAIGIEIYNSSSSGNPTVTISGGTIVASASATGFGIECTNASNPFTLTATDTTIEGSTYSIYLRDNTSCTVTFTDCVFIGEISGWSEPQ